MHIAIKQKMNDDNPKNNQQAIELDLSDNEDNWEARAQQKAREIEGEPEMHTESKHASPDKLGKLSSDPDKIEVDFNRPDRPTG